MAEELTYLLITPYTIMKSRTGGVLARLLSRTDVDLVGVQMISPTKELAEEYSKQIKKTIGNRDKHAANLFAEYVKDNFTPLPNGKRKRVFMLLFKGEDACRKLFSIAGHVVSKHPDYKNQQFVTGETIRDTYADLVLSKNGDLRYFEPAVLTPPNHESALSKLELFANFIKNNSNIIDNSKETTSDIERTLVIIKPDNWRHPSTKPGNIIDMLSRTGLRIIGCKIFGMTVEDALNFYGPVQNSLRSKLAPVFGKKAKKVLEDNFNITLPDESTPLLTEAFGKPYADNQFNCIIEFMTGMRADRCPKGEEALHSHVKCMVLIYEGSDAIKKIRKVLGPTDPTKAPGGTIRRDFGQDVMINTAHASDSTESVLREMEIVKIKQNKMADIIFKYLKKLGK